MSYNILKSSINLCTISLLFFFFQQAAEEHSDIIATFPTSTSHAGHNHAQSKLNDNLIDRSPKVDGVKAINKIRQNSRNQRQKQMWVKTDCFELCLRLIFPEIGWELQGRGREFALCHLTNNLTSNKPKRCSGSWVEKGVSTWGSLECAPTPSMKNKNKTHGGHNSLNIKANFIGGGSTSERKAA